MGGYDARLPKKEGSPVVRMVWCIVLLGLGSPTFAQDTALPGQTEPVDEIIVPGRTPENLRVEIQRLEGAVYERFNALNSNDEFDILCREQAPTGSNIPLRTCAPKFVIDAESGSARGILQDGRSRSGNNYNPAEHKMRMEQKSRELTDEMQRLARTDEQLMRDLVRLDELKQLQANAEGRRARR